jgi:hypothetical protein
MYKVRKMAGEVNQMKILEGHKMKILLWTCARTASHQHGFESSDVRVRSIKVRFMLSLELVKTADLFGACQSPL